MKTAAFSRFARRAMFLVVVALVFVQHAALACPGCKQNMAAGADGKVPPLSGASIGFSVSIFFMIFMVLALLGGLGLMMYRSCRVLAVQQRAALERMEAEEAAAVMTTGLPAQA